MPKFVSMGQEDPMSTLCRMVIDTKYEDLPSNVVNHAKQYILDTMAVTIGGSAMEGIPAVVDLVKSRGGKPESTIPFYGGKVPASEAGLAIGPMARAMDLGDVAAGGKLLGLSLDELENAEGIARTMTQPHDQAMYRPAKLIVRVHHGFVCQDAINACLLAKRGITGTRQEVLAGSRGYLGFAKWETDVAALTKRLGEEYSRL